MRSRLSLSAVSLITLLGFIDTSPADVIFVNDDVAVPGDGSTWSTALNALDNALALASTGDEIRVATGTYAPTGSSFAIPNGVTVLGGFAGIDEDESSDPASNLTVLTSDRFGDDIPDDPQTFADNASTIMLIENANDLIQIDGFTFNISSPGPTGFDSAGALRAENCTLDVSRCHFINVNGVRQIDGGAANLEASSVTFEHCSFHDNQAIFNGGAIYGDGLLQFAARQCTFDGNASGIRGGAVSIRMNGIVTDPLVIDDCTFEGNSASIDAALELDAMVIDLRDCIVQFNTATDERLDQRTVARLDADEFTMTRCQWIGNVGTIEGNRFGINDTSTIVDSLFVSNAGGTHGAVLWGRSDDLTIVGSVFIDNASMVHGGALTLGSRVEFCRIEDCMFDQNTAPRGGAVFMQGEMLEVHETQFTENAATVDGGALFVDGIEEQSEVAMTSTSFEANASSGFAGAVWMNDGTLTADGALFGGNTAIAGGAIAIVDTTAAFDHIDVIDNVATFGGGGIDALRGTLVVDNARFERNTGRDGGAIALDTVNAIVRDASFEMNDAINQGGAMFATSSTVTLATCDILNNAATFDGGGAAIIGSDMTAFDMTLVDNESLLASGGGWAQSGGSIVMDFAELTGNTATTSGGLMFDGDTMTLANVVLEGNSSPMVNTSCIAFSMDDCTAQNSPDSVAVESQSDTVIIRDCIFDECRTALSLTGTGTDSLIRIERVDALGSTQTGIACNSSERLEMALVRATASASSLSITGIESGLIANSIFSGGSRVVNSTFNDHVELVNCVITDGQFAGLDHSSGNLTTRNCTIVGNSIGIRIVFGGPIDIFNCIVWLNGDETESDQIQTSSFADDPSVSFSLVQGLTGDLGGVGNIDGDPLFIHLAGDDGIVGTLDDLYRVMSGSPVIDAGNAVGFPNDVLDLNQSGSTNDLWPFDINRDPRFAGMNFDIGAAEFQGNPADCPADCAPLGGNGQVNVDDLVAVLLGFGTSGPCDIVPLTPDGTIGDGVIIIDDVIAVVNNFGPCP
ncbi:MAG: hypothetical protein AAF432_07095 [Planctomycetota bacterium]